MGDLLLQLYPVWLHAVPRRKTSVSVTPLSWLVYTCNWDQQNFAIRSVYSVLLNCGCGFIVPAQDQRQSWIVSPRLFEKYLPLQGKGIPLYLAVYSNTSLLIQYLPLFSTVQRYCIFFNMFAWETWTVLFYSHFTLLVNKDAVMVIRLFYVSFSGWVSLPWATTLSVVLVTAGKLYYAERHGYI